MARRPGRPDHRRRRCERHGCPASSAHRVRPPLDRRGVLAARPLSKAEEGTTKRALASLGYAVLAVAAALGVGLSAAFLLVSTDLGRRLVVPHLVRFADDALAGRIELASFRLGTKGGLELSGVRVVDPDGEVVLSADRVRVDLDLGRLRSKEVSGSVELVNPVVALKREDDGTLSIARAFAPTHPRPKRADETPFAWTVRVTRLTMRGAAVSYVDAAGKTAFAADHLDADGRGAYGPRGARVELSLRGAMTAPEAAPLSIEAAGGLRGTQVRVRLLRASVGDTALDAVADFDRATWKGRAALLALGVDASAVRDLAPRAPLAGDLAGTLYAESDGSAATAALALSPPGGQGGRAEAAAALRLPPGATALGFDVAAERLDLARVLRGAPGTELSLTARGHARGRDLASLEGALSLSLAPSRLRGGRVGRAEVRATADRGTVDVSRLEAALPGASVQGRGRFRQGGAVEAHLTADGTDLAVLRRDLEALLDRKLPAFSGKARVEADVRGTTAAPLADLRVASPSLTGPGFTAREVALKGSLAGPFSAPRAQLGGGAARLLAGRLDVRSAQVRGQLDGRRAEVTVTGAVPDLGPEPLTVAGVATLSPDRHALAVSALTLSWPGDRFELTGPATVDLRGPSVDRLALASGAQRILLEGGLAGAGKRRALDARARVEAVDLALLPVRAMLPRKLGIGGKLSLDATAKGPAAAPQVSGRVELVDAAVAGVDRLAAVADVQYDGKARRARVDLGGRRDGGGTLEAKLDLPVSLARAPRSAPLAVDVTLAGVPVADALALAHREDLLLVGTASAGLRIRGTVGRPELDATAALADGRYRDLGPFAATVRFEDAGDEGRLVASADWHGTRAGDLEARAPLATADLLRAPAQTVKALATAPAHVLAEVPGLDVATFAGRRGLPADLRGRLTAKAELGGTARAPRGTVTLALADGAFEGYAGVALDLAATARENGLEVRARTGLGGEEVATLEGSLDAAVERLVQRGALEAVPLQATIVVHGTDLRRAGMSVPLAGSVQGTIAAAGTLAAPRLTVDLAGRRLEVAGHPLGDATLTAEAQGRRMHGEVHVAVATGGTLDGTLDVHAPLDLAALRSGALKRAPAQAKLVANAVDLRVLPALAPGRVRNAAGKLGADLVAAGPLGRLSPKGTLAVEGAAVTIAEYGDWTDVVVRASLSEDTFRLDRLEARRGDGRIEAKAQAVGLARKGQPADVTAEVHADGLTLPRAGQDLATLTLDATMKGAFSADSLDGEVQVPRAVVKLPNRAPRRIQPLGERDDIVIGPFKKRARVKAAAAGDEEGRSYRAKVHLRAPNQLWVKSDSPRIDVELKADVTAEYGDGEFVLVGDVETLRGQVEPIAGRNFEVKLARVHFTGGDYTDATLEVQALYTNPEAKVTVVITGTVESPEIKLTSDPAMDEGQIAMLIATGRANLKAGSGGVGTLTPDAAVGAAGAAAGAYLTGEFKKLVGDKLPVDTVQIDASQLRAGKYVTDKLYVGYTFRVGAKVEQGENTNEVRLEFQITPRWTLEGRAGDAGTGGGSLIWSKDY
ncbi:MAG: translocation/assembly module TamB domain-containing protein [Anaeromyxobacteraceae bacterium]